MFTRGLRRCSVREDKDLEVRRQLFHLIAISLWLVPIVYFPRWLTLFIFLLVILLNALLVLKVEPVHRFFNPLVESLEREKNVDKPSVQALYANLGVFLSFLVFDALSVVGVVVLAVGDSFSTIVGKLRGRNKLPWNENKSFEGTLAFFLSSYCALLFILPYGEAILIANLCALLESVDTQIDDNLLIPITASAVAYLV
ncbi:MAG: phosphatidate cytidylyltransferase [Aquificae bacterium]|nr:phosphatidate cytidylyltransferase [Aquificota bacterium]